jgi:subtilisin family serine protease
MCCTLLSSTVFALAALTSSPGSTAEAPRQGAHWVFFVDRESLGIRAEDVTALSSRALERRALRRDPTLGLVDHRDLPIDPSLVASLRSEGATIRTTSRWLNAASVLASPAQLQRIAALPGVRHVQPVRTAAKADAWLGELPPPAEGGIAGDLYGASFDQIAQIDLVALHERGFMGQGVVIGVLDTGFNLVHDAFHQPGHELQVLAQYDFINDDPNTGIEPTDPPSQHRHGTWVLGTIGAWLPGTLIGAAPQAAFVLAKTEDVSSETPIEEDYYVAGLEFIEAEGADIATSSLGYFDWYSSEDLDGLTAVTTIAVNIATLNGLICLTAAGNGGHDEDPSTLRLGAPADAFDVITCGAVDAGGVAAGFSSDGPSADGRVKPEVLARGVAVATVHSTNSVDLAALNGTSFSTPLTAGAVACMLSARPTMSVSSIRGALMSTATDALAGAAPDPLFIRGYGIVQADAASRHGLSLADLTLDGVVDGADLGALLAQWGPCAMCAADLDGDGLVGGADLGALLAAWGS